MIDKIQQMGETKVDCFPSIYMSLQFNEKIIGQNDTQNPLHERNRILTLFPLLYDTSI